jgi:hypothetical protein
MIILFLIIIIIFNYCSCKSSSIKKSLSNLSPTITSLPCVINREQRIYPIISNDNQQKLLEQIHLLLPSLYSAEKVFIKKIINE